LKDKEQQSLFNIYRDASYPEQAEQEAKIEANWLELRKRKRI